MSERDFKGVWIPKEVWLNKELTMIEKVILTEIDSLDNENHCIASNEYFAEFCNCGVATVTRAIKHLKDLNYIREVAYDGRHRKLSLIKMISQTNQNDESASSKRLTNNIDNNTTNNKDIITINSNNTEFLGKIKNTKKKSLYDKCYDQILEFTNNVGLIDALTEYLKIRLQMKDKPLYLGTWQGMLKKLAKMDNQIDVVNTSIERGWASFFEQKSYSKGKEKFGEDDNIKSVKGEFDSSGETF